MSNEVFIANTPQLRPHLREYVFWRVSHPFTPIANFPSPSGELEKDKNISTERSIQRISTGVNAETRENAASYYYDLEKIEYVETTYTLSNGKKVTVETPKGTTPPSQAVVEDMYSDK